MTLGSTVKQMYFAGGPLDGKMIDVPDPPERRLRVPHPVGENTVRRQNDPPVGFEKTNLVARYVLFDGFYLWCGSE